MLKFSKFRYSFGTKINSEWATLATKELKGKKTVEDLIFKTNDVNKKKRKKTKKKKKKNFRA